MRSHVWFLAIHGECTTNNNKPHMAHNTFVVLRNVSDCKVMFRSLLYGMCLVVDVTWYDYQNGCLRL